jgi:gluconate 2-dehydrogenase gamma chain
MTFLPRRRAFLRTATLVPAAAVAAVPVHFVGNPAAPGGAYFNPAEQAFIDAAIARLIPADELGPGAKESGVAGFIDSQLAGPFGRAVTWYMQGPWPKGTPEQGYQLKYTPAQLYRAAIAEIDAYCARSYGGRSFAKLDAQDQDRVLHGLEKNEIALGQAPAKTFFDMLWNNTQEGFLADPMYGGNRGFAGWKLIGFPGPRYNYVAEIEQYGQRYAQPVVGLLGRDPDARTA